MKRNMHRLLILVGFFAFSLCCHADTYNRAATVSIKGIDISKLISKRQVEKIFHKRAGAINEFEFSGCTANYDSMFSGRGYTARFEVGPDDNADIEFSSLEDKTGKVKINVPDLKGLLWVSFDSTALDAYAIKIDSKVISSKIRLTDFKRMFPISAAAQIEEGSVNVKRYAVLLGEVDDANATLESASFASGALPYTSFIKFTFYKGVIKRIYIWQGVAC